MPSNKIPSGHLEASEYTIKDIFDSQYIIPNYQRGYAWSEDDVEVLIDDLRDACDHNKGMYFLSNITVCLDTENADNANQEALKDHEYVIDGQQRLVTLSLLLAVLRCYLRQEDNPDNSNGFTIGLIYTCLQSDEQKTRILLDNQDDAICFKSIVLSDNILPVDGTVSSRKVKMKQAYRAIVSRLEDLAGAENKEKLLKFTKFLLRDVLVIKNTVIDEEYACQIFESLNDRGVTLTAFDLIKNRLFLLSTTPESTKKETEKHIKEIQSQIKGALGNGRTLSSNTKDYFRVYLQINKKDGFVDDGGMYKIFKDQVKTPAEVQDFLKKLKEDKNLQSYLAFKRPTLDSQYLQNIDTAPDKAKLNHYFNHVKLLKICQPVLFSLFYKNSDNNETIRKTLKDLYCLTTRIVLSRNRLSNIQDLLARIAFQMYKEAENFSELLQREFEDQQYQKYTSKKFQEEIAAYSEFKEKHSKQILFDICVLKSKSLMTFVRQYKELSIEHILPQSRSKKTYAEINEQDHQFYLNNLGNHTILTTSDNSKIKNFEIEKKLEMFKSAGYKGFPVVNNIENYLKSPPKKKEEVVKEEAHAIEEKNWTVESITERKNDLIKEYMDLVKFSWEE
jgi:uncharacterized protein with ParB-like and HNH nuclease domain